MPRELFVVIAYLVMFFGCNPSQDSDSLPARADPALVEAPVAVPGAVAIPEEPISLNEALKIADLSALSPPSDAFRKETEPFSFSYSKSVTTEQALEEATVDLKTQLVKVGWQLSADPAPQSYQSGAVMFFQKQELWILASLGKSNGFPSGEELNVLATVTGNVDPRTLPRPETRELQSAEPSSIVYVTPLELLEVRKFYRTRLDELGWLEIKFQPIEGIEIPMEIKEREQNFIQNGVMLDLYLERLEEGTRVIVRPVMLTIDLPIPLDADDLELGDDPPYLFCTTHQKMETLRSFFTTEMERRGWKVTEQAIEPAEKIDSALSFQAEGREPLRCGFLQSGKLVFLQLKLDR